MKRLERWFRCHKRTASACVFLFFVILSCSSFPFYNLTKPYRATLAASILFINASVYGYLGAFLTKLRPRARFRQVFLIHFAVVLGGMLVRFLLEFGEVSNTYNFTLPNITLHFAATLTISTLSWWWTHRQPK